MRERERETAAMTSSKIEIPGEVKSDPAALMASLQLMPSPVPNPEIKYTKVCLLCSLFLHVNTLLYTRKHSRFLLRRSMFCVFKTFFKNFFFVCQQLQYQTVELINFPRVNFLNFPSVERFKAPVGSLVRPHAQCSPELNNK